jgi:hypothetical protein
MASGDKFTLFSQAVTNGNLVAITAPAGVAFVNNLAVDGSISVVNTSPTNMAAQVVGNQLTLSWPSDHTGWHLQAQTNSPGSGLGTNWANVSGTGSANSYTTTLDPTNGSVFYRLVYP